jgi:NADPH2:quinone reductase
MTRANNHAVNPLDRKLRDMNIFNFSLPAVLGWDFTGIVIKVGPEVSFPIGSRVFSQMVDSLPPTGGGLQEYTTINSLYSAIVPKEISDIEASMYPVNLMTAANCLFTPGFGLPFPGTPEAKDFDYKSQKVAIVGGATHTGKFAIQLLRICGVGTIIAIASASGAELLKSLGATHVVARQAADIEAQVRNIVGDDLIYVYDTVTAGPLDLAASLLSESKKGTLMFNVLGQVSEAMVATKKAGIEITRVQGFSSLVPEFGKLCWKQFPIWLEKGDIKPSGIKVIEGLDAAKVNAALDEYVAGNGLPDRYVVRHAGTQPVSVPTSNA